MKTFDLPLPLSSVLFNVSMKIGGKSDTFLFLFGEKIFSLSEVKNYKKDLDSGEFDEEDMGRYYGNLPIIMSNNPSYAGNTLFTKIYTPKEDLTPIKKDEPIRAILDDKIPLRTEYSPFAKTIPSESTFSHLFGFLRKYRGFSSSKRQLPPETAEKKVSFSGEESLTSPLTDTFRTDSGTRYSREEIERYTINRRVKAMQDVLLTGGRRGKRESKVPSKLCMDICYDDGFEGRCLFTIASTSSPVRINISQILPMTLSFDDIKAQSRIPTEDDALEELSESDEASDREEGGGRGGRGERTSNASRETDKGKTKTGGKEPSEGAPVKVDIAISIVSKQSEVERYRKQTSHTKSSTSAFQEHQMRLQSLLGKRGEVLDISHGSSSILVQSTKTGGKEPSEGAPVKVDIAISIVSTQSEVERYRKQTSHTKSSTSAFQEHQMRLQSLLGKRGEVLDISHGSSSILVQSVSLESWVKDWDAITACIKVYNKFGGIGLDVCSQRLSGSHCVINMVCPFTSSKFVPSRVEMKLFCGNGLILMGSANVPPCSGSHDLCFPVFLPVSSGTNRKYIDMLVKSGSVSYQPDEKEAADREKFVSSSIAHEKKILEEFIGKEWVKLSSKDERGKKKLNFPEYTKERISYLLGAQASVRIYVK
ncbi:hypothetical protein ADUPG1_009817 [Aduncisulcus paluster]|uniref:Uncharacterized protein n=1 Tax=Aduncisulcus paluster TaxID=2918883 RepID=A0ABQ5L0R4_9EUKA|nr:hypothetical protein ADUPG1_009817 [Aduncisulcus paluster]